MGLPITLRAILKRTKTALPSLGTLSVPGRHIKRPANIDTEGEIGRVRTECEVESDGGNRERSVWLDTLVQADADVSRHGESLCTPSRPGEHSSST